MDSDSETSQIRTIGRYQVLDELGRGAMAVVYKGFDPKIGRTVALKTIAIGLGDSEAREFRQRLYREASAAGTLAHANIVTIYDIIEEHDGTTAVAMEFIEGRTLQSIIEERGPLPLDEALAIFEQVCTALDFAGARGIVHRDIKPANIMITSDGRAKVADFGVARVALSKMTQTGTVVGSPAYMSPEQIRGQHLDARSDLFSAAIVLFEMLTTQRPFAGDDIATTLFRIVHEAPTPITSVKVGMNPGLNQVFERALAKDPQQRFQTGAELMAALRAAAAGETAPWASALSDTAFTGAKPALGAPAGVAPAAGAPRPSWLLPAVGGVGLVIAAGVVVLILRQPQQLPAGGAGSSGAAGRAAETGPSTGPGRAGETTRAPQGPGAPPAAVSPAAPSPQPQPVAPSTTAAGAGTTTAARPGRGGAGSAAATATRETAEAAPAPPKRGSIGFTFEGDPYPITLSADGRSIGRIAQAGDRLEVASGRVRVRATNETLFLQRDFGSITVRSGERTTLEAPALASAFIGVKGEIYEGLSILVDGRAVPGPYPAQIPKIAASPHKVVFQWSTGKLAGTEVAGAVDLTGGRLFRVQVVPESDQVVVQKVR